MEPTLKTVTYPEIRFGPCVLRPAENLVIYRTRQLRLEPKIAQVLKVLAERQGEVVTRDQLIQVAWGGRAVSDDAVARCISQIRKALGTELQAPVTITAISKKGYRLDVESGHLRSAVKLSVVAVIAVGLLALPLLISRDESGGTKSLVRESVLVSADWERYPAFSPDGSRFAYSRGTPAGPRAIYLRNLADAETVRLTDGKWLDHQPVFSPDGERLAFARVEADKCHVMLMPASGSTASRIADCGARGVKGLAWLPGGEQLLMLTSDQRLSPARMLRIDINNGQSSDITPHFARGVDDFALSDSGRLAISVDFNLGVEDIFLGDMEKPDSWQRITHDRVKIHGLAWDSDQLLFSSNRGGPFQLWRWVGADAGLEIIHQALNGVDALSTHPDGHILVERWEQETEIVTLDDSESVLIEPKGVSWDARVSPRGGAVAYISDRSGSAELWLRDGLVDRVITDYRGPWVMHPRWSPDGSKIAVTVPIDGVFTLQIFDLAKAGPELHAQVKEAFAGEWAADGQSLVFGSKRTGSWQIWRYFIEDGRLQQLTDDGGKTAKLDHAGQQLYFTLEDQSGVWRTNLIDPDTPEQVVDDLAPVDWSNWHLDEERLYYVRRSGGKAPELVHYDLAARTEVGSTLLPDLIYFSGVTVDPLTSAVTYSRITREDADIDLLRLVTRQ